METLKNWIKVIWSKVKSNDKVKHILANFLIVLIVGLLFNSTLGLAAAIVASLGKEIYDEYRPNGTGWDFLDLIADLIGIILGFILII